MLTYPDAVVEGQPTQQQLHRHDEQSPGLLHHQESSERWDGSLFMRKGNINYVR